MRDFITAKMMLAQLKMKKAAKEFVENEKGGTGFVEIMLIVVIVIALAVIFKDNLTKIAENVFSQLTDFIGE